MEEINSLECEKNNLIKTVESSKQENFILKQNLNNLKEENFNLEIQLKDKNSEIEKLNFESTKEKNEISHLNVKLKDILDSKEKDLLDYQKTIEDYQRTIESLNLKLANEESNNLKKVEELKIQNDLQIKLLENKIHEISESKNRLKKEIQNLQNRVQSLYQKLIIVETENCELIEKLKDLEIKELEMTLVSVSVEQAVQVDNVKIKDMFTQMEYSSLEKSIQSEFFHNNKSVQSDFAFTDKSTQVIPSSTNKYIQADSEIILQSKLYEKAIQVEEISTNLEQTFETFLHKIELFLQLEHSDLTHKDRLNIILEKVERLKNEYIQLELSFKRKSDQFLLLKKSRVNDLQINLKNNPTINSFLVENKKKRENLSKFVNEAFEKLDSFK
ncbi:hypothetical protein O9G_002181 [Rozella allomycis CSF55]|uniref:Uncharacterized protein n=1 Tax=Rozella allomycis (strain CSF55) TaxID=988480 RepID=A0A075AQ27_ROZAC|nr:hypothetical protein O9G_002181 [Rozella allomycis CSF55]|eukprot:EPZ32341.1 hypothetical protein O9G_002181 [Rozella allomycis CSF55]